MMVANWMTTHVITADKSDSIKVAQQLFKQHDISLLPVKEKARLCGVLSEGDLYRTILFLTAQQADFDHKIMLSHMPVSQVMTPNVITVPVDFTVEETIARLIENKIHGAPVVDASQDLIGVITRTDLLRAVVDLTGVGRRGIQYAFELEDRSGSIKGLSDTIRKHGGRVASILTSCEGVKNGYRKVYIRMYGIDRFKLRRLNKALRQKATFSYVIDHLEIRKEDFGSA